MTKEEYIKLADKYKQNKCSEEEKKLFESILDKFQVNQEGIEWDLINQQKSKDKIQRVMYDKMNPKVSGKSSQSYMRQIARVAASLVLIAGLAYLFFTNSNTKQSESAPLMITKNTVHDQRSSITLSDGTVVHLNTNSSITFAENFTGNTRRLKLSGEAFFEVVRDEDLPFEVISGPVKTVVLGTSFNINAKDKNIEVSVASGKVAVSSMVDRDNNNNERQAILQANEKVTYDHINNTLAITEADIQLALAWKNAEINFSNTTLRYAATILSARYNKDIIIENPAINNCRITNRYIDESLTNILDGLEFIIDVKYKVNENNQIVLYGTGCDD
jgi:ferric-dicitrate binding protein FerR (iron transport regulator)